MHVADLFEIYTGVIRVLCSDEAYNVPATKSYFLQ